MAGFFTARILVPTPMHDKSDALPGDFFAIPDIHVIRMQGRDAIAFAQAQFMNDVAATQAKSCRMRIAIDIQDHHALRPFAKRRLTCVFGCGGERLAEAERVQLEELGALLVAGGVVALRAGRGPRLLVERRPKRGDRGTPNVHARCLSVPPEPIEVRLARLQRLVQVERRNRACAAAAAVALGAPLLLSPGPAEDAAAAAGDIAIRLIPVYGITIPVIVRKGQLQAVAALNNPRVVTEEGVPVLRIEMTRTGDRSTFGEIRVIKPGLPDPVLIARGIAIYTEVGIRHLALPLTPEQAAEMRSGNLRFEYRELPEKGGALLASIEGSMG